MILTGGYNNGGGVTRVSEYNEAGYLRDLPELQQGRQGHACSYYNNSNGAKVGLCRLRQLNKRNLNLRSAHID